MIMILDKKSDSSDAYAFHRELHELVFERVIPIPLSKLDSVLKIRLRFRYIVERLVQAGNNLD